MECQSVNVTVINVYVPPTHDTVPPPFDDLLHQNNTIVVGDMNARNRLWVSNTTDARGRALPDAISAHGYVVLNTEEGTYQTYHGSMTHIDVSLASFQTRRSADGKRDGIRARPDHHNNQRTPRTTKYDCAEVEIRRGRLSSAIASTTRSTQLMSQTTRSTS